MFLQKFSPLGKVLEKLKNLQRWDHTTGDCGPFAGSIDYEKDNIHGEGIRVEDLAGIIKEFDSNKL
jgi:hypothetical protein